MNVFVEYFMPADDDCPDQSGIETPEETTTAVSPRLTSLRCKGRVPTLRDLVQKGYLEGRPASRRLSALNRPSSRGSAFVPQQRRPVAPSPVRRPGEARSSQRSAPFVLSSNHHPRVLASEDSQVQVYAMEVMFDEMRAGLQERLPDLRASAPHSLGCSSFAITDDVPVDVRIDLRNIVQLDIDDSYFDADFDITFS